MKVEKSYCRQLWFGRFLFNCFSKNREFVKQYSSFKILLPKWREFTTKKITGSGQSSAVFFSGFFV